MQWYGYSTAIDIPFAVAVDKITNELEKHGFYHLLMFRVN
jgi:hypothetical protein